MPNSPLLAREGVYDKLALEPARPKLTVAGASSLVPPFVPLRPSADPPPLRLPRAEWVQAKQSDIFSKEASARYAKLIAQRGADGEPEGKERQDLTTTVRGVPVRYYA